MSHFPLLLRVPRLGAGISNSDPVEAIDTLDGWSAKEFPVEVRVTLKGARRVPKGNPKGAKGIQKRATALTKNTTCGKGGTNEGKGEPRALRFGLTFDQQIDKMQSNNCVTNKRSQNVKFTTKGSAN